MCSIGNEGDGTVVMDGEDEFMACTVLAEGCGCDHLPHSAPGHSMATVCEYTPSLSEVCPFSDRLWFQMQSPRKLLATSLRTVPKTYS